jgi:hypothetical protein
MNLDSFSHGQIKSKMWLCEKLEPLIPDKSHILILGAWLNTLGFMLLTRNPKKYSQIKAIDIDPNSVELANKVCDYWYIEGPQRSEVADANNYEMRGYNVIINCSSEHMNGNRWFENIPKNTLVCIQSSNVTNLDEAWDIKTPSPTFESFMEKYPLSVGIFSGVLPIQYDHWGYDRYMTIGIK